MAWRSVKLEYVYLNPCDTDAKLWRGLELPLLQQ